MEMGMEIEAVPEGLDDGDNAGLERRPPYGLLTKYFSNLKNGPNQGAGSLSSNSIKSFSVITGKN
jgi:hypothetical protein